MNTFTLDDLHQVLISRSAFIYHGAGFAKGLGNNQTNSLPYLSRLTQVIQNDIEISCSTIRPGDRETHGNYWGRIGLILKQKDRNSITLVSNQDAGTLPSDGGKRSIQRLPITISDIANSIDERPPNHHNEWCVLSYTVFGIYIEDPIQYTDGDTIQTLSLNNVIQTFPGSRIFTQDNQNILREVLPSGMLGTILNVSDIYN